MNTRRIIHVALLLLAVLSFQSATVYAQGTAFTYQGRLTSNGLPANGSFDLQFRAFDNATGGNQVGGGTVTSAGVSVTNGLFTTTIDFGAGIFTGGARWLEIGVRPGSTQGAFAILLPRQPLTATPYSIAAGTVSGGIAAGQLTGTIPLTQLPASLVTNKANGLTLGGFFTGNGSGLTDLSASTILSGILADAVLSPNVALHSGGNAFTGDQTIMGGSVGIGTTTPQGQLGVDGNVRFEVQTGAYNEGLVLNAPPDMSAFGGYGGIVFHSAPRGGDLDGGTVKWALDYNYSPETGVGPGGLAFIQNNVNTRLFLDAGGNVGIGTNIPASALHVAGTVTANTFNGPGALPWAVVTGTAQAAQPNSGYLLTSDTVVTVTLPPAPNPGDVVRVSSAGATRWKVAQNDGQSVLAKNLSGNQNVTWTRRASNQNWNGVASSADGVTLVGILNYGPIYVSTDSGITWTPRASNQSWAAIASSADGIKLVATVNGGQIYGSVSSGDTWIPLASSQYWRGVACSADGSQIVAVVDAGRIYISTDFGNNWTARADTQPWYAVACSADGSKICANVFGGQIYTSADAGVTWTPHFLYARWVGIAASADGVKLVTAVNGGLIYTSTDAGVTWTPRASAQNWYSFASSADGSKLVAALTGGQIYTSTDSGVTWTPRASTQAWDGVASSADGSKLVGSVYGGQLYTSSPGSVSSTSVGAAGYLLGEPLAALELQYLGNGQFLPISHEGSIGAY